MKKAREWGTKLRPFSSIPTVLASLAILCVVSVSADIISAAGAREADIPFQSIVPSDWTLLSSEPQSYGRRYVSPAGDAWLWFFAVPADREAAVNANTDRVAAAPSERVTYAARGGDWVVSSGYRGDRIFYRRAMLACNGTKWRHIEFEYPAAEKLRLDDFVTRTSFALRAYQNAGCKG